MAHVPHETRTPSVHKFILGKLIYDLNKPPKPIDDGECKVKYAKMTLFHLNFNHHYGIVGIANEFQFY